MSEKTASKKGKKKVQGAALPRSQEEDLQCHSNQNKGGGVRGGWWGGGKRCGGGIFSLLFFKKYKA